MPDRPFSRLIIICATAQTVEPATNNITLSICPSSLGSPAMIKTPKNANPIPKARVNPSFSFNKMVPIRASMGPSSCTKMAAVDASIPLSPL